MAKKIVCGNCGNKYTIEVTYCLNCGAVVGKSTAEIRKAINKHVPDRYIPSRWEDVKEWLSNFRLTMPRWRLSIPEIHFPKFTWRLPELFPFIESWRNDIVKNWEPKKLENKKLWLNDTGLLMDHPQDQPLWGEGMLSPDHWVQDIKRQNPGPIEPVVSGGPFYVDGGQTINEKRKELGLPRITNGDGDPRKPSRFRHTLVVRLEEDYPFLTMKEHTCTALWEEIDNYAVCTNCGEMMARNLPDYTDTGVYGKTPVKELVDAVRQTHSLRDKMSQYFNKGAVPFGKIALSNNKKVAKIFKTGLGLEWTERVGFVVQEPKAFVKTDDIK